MTDAENESVVNTDSGSSCDTCMCKKSGASFGLSDISKVLEVDDIM